MVERYDHACKEVEVSACIEMGIVPPANLTSLIHPVLENWMFQRKMTFYSFRREIQIREDYCLRTMPLS